jgi:hypothetical protein
MHIRRLAFLFHLVLLPGFAMAETIDLVCVHREYGMTLNFNVDTLRSTIVHNGVLAREVYIDKTTISFIVDLSSGEYFHFVSRRSGNMTVKAPDGTLIYGHECRETLMNSTRNPSLHF